MTSSSLISKLSEQDKETWLDARKPKIVVCGMKKSGKSSILRVLFNKLSPHEAGYLEPTPQPCFVSLKGKNPLLNVEIAEIPGSWSWEESDAVDQLFFAQCQSLIIVIDASSGSDDAPLPASVFSFAKRIIARALKVRRQQGLFIHLFLNKVDANFRFDPDSPQAEARKASFLESISTAIAQEAKVEIQAHCTCIFDNSIHEAFSKVIQRPLLANGKIEQILDIMVTCCRLEKAVLFDLGSKITFGSDSAQTDSNTVSLMQDLLDVIIDMIAIYGAYDDAEGGAKTSCNIALSNGQVIYMRLIEAPNLALVSILKAENFEKSFLLNHNVDAFRNALMQIVTIS
jgi:Ras-related GTP-binding protein C/D